jgi:ribosomal protein S20
MSPVTRRRWLTIAGGGAAAAVLLVGIGAAGAIAASRVLSPNDESKAVIDDAARQLGVTPSELTDALEQALKNRIDDAVHSGRLTEEQGKRLKERIDSGDYPLLFAHGFGPHASGFGFRGFGHGLWLGRHGGFAIAETAAAYLGMSEDELREALHDKTLAEIAKENGKSVDGLVKALVAAEEKAIDEAVADGRITKSQAAEIKSKLAERMQALVDGELRRSFRPHPGFWPGSGSPRGPPPAFGGPRA